MGGVAEKRVAGKEERESWETISTAGVMQKVLPAAGGSFIEWYEVAIYSYLSTYTTANFFADGRGGSLGTWAGFAITFAVRPLGGVLFGYVADRCGRKPAMQGTILLMLITTILQGCLPTFRSSGESWGWFGFAALMVLRVLQGLSAGGELSTAAVYISEVSPREHLGANLSFVVSSVFAAWVAAAAVVYGLQSCLSHEEMMDWGWRVPYLTSALPGACLVFVRRFLTETPDFEALLSSEVEKQSGEELEEGRPKSAQAEGVWQELMSSYKTAMVIGALGTAGIGVLWYVPPLYGVQFIKQYHELPARAVTAAELLMSIIPAVLGLWGGKLVDKVGAGKVHTVCVVLGAIVAPLPLFYWWTHASQSQALLAVFVGEIVLGLLQTLTTAVYLWVVELFPVRVRVSGMSVAYNIGVGIFGGLGPLVADAGNRVIDPRGLISAPAAVTLFAGLISLAAIIASRMLAKRGLLRLTHIRESPY